MEIPARIVGNCTSIKAEVVSKDIPLLLSKKAMKAAKVNIDFVNDKIEIFDSDLDIICRTSGQYCTPIFSFEHIDHENKSEVLLSMNDMNSKEENRKVAKKLHRQFRHTTSVKLIELLKNADTNDKELCVIIKEITKECEVCSKTLKKQTRPVVGFPLATEFNEYVAMYLNQWSYQDKVWLTHIVHHLTRYSASCVIQSKGKEVTAESISKMWIAIFGSPKSFLVDNGGKFNNSEFLSFCENLNTNIKTTAAEAHGPMVW